MRLYYYQCPAGNFGDDLNAWLWPRIAPELFDDDGRTLFIGIGTILNHKIPRSPLKVVFGSGAGLGRMPELSEDWKVYCVRGPLTAAALGLPADAAIIDPAVLVRTLLPGGNRDGGVAFMPHIESLIRAELQGLSFAAACESAGVRYLDPRGGVEQTLQAIGQSSLVLAEAMHAAIVADALRVPWKPMRFFEHILGFKWRDWCQSVELDDTAFESSPASAALDQAALVTAIQQAADGRQAMLSEDSVLDSAIDRLSERFGQLRRDHAAGLLTVKGAETQDSPVDESPSTQDPRDWWRQVHDAAQELAASVPDGQMFICVGDEPSAEIAAGRRCLPYPERDGYYNGPPEDDAAAVRELERMRGEGAGFAVFAWPAFWWLDYYPRLRSHLRNRFPCVLENERLVIFDLRSPRVETVEGIS